MITPWLHQPIGADVAVANLKKYAIHYISWEERTGKSLTGLLAAEQLAISSVLVITKKKALEGWKELLEKYETKKEITATNFHQVGKLKGDYDLIIIDEAHSYISSLPKPSAMFKSLRPICHKKPIIFMSATPCAQGPAWLFHQLHLSFWSPWYQYKTFYTWHRVYGKPYKQYLGTHEVTKYDKVDDDRVMACVEHLIDTKTRAELGFEHEPEDKLHYVELGVDTKFVYNTIVKDRVYKFASGHELVGDSVTKVRYALHMLEGGVVKINDDYLVLANREKIDYILDKWGDTEGLVIMYNFIAEKVKLENAFKHAKILQGTSNAEGVDLSMHKHLVIYSQDYSTARYSQRRARQANMERKVPITVHYLLVSGGISAAVYETVAVNKVNYIDRFYSGSVV